MDRTHKKAFCPHCGDRTRQERVHAQTCEEWIGRSLVDDEELKVPLTYFVASCEMCNQILLYTLIGDNHGQESFDESNLEYPGPGRLSPFVPESIKEIYEEATKIRLSNPSAFATQIRRALEALCIDRGVKDGVLQVKLANLVSRGELPATFAEAASLLRDFGNKGAHPSDKFVKVNQVNALDKFFRAIVDYVYVAPNTLKALRESLSRS